jgi:hypothetical protein
MVSAVTQIVIESAQECWGRNYLLAIVFSVRDELDAHWERALQDLLGASTGIWSAGGISRDCEVMLRFGNRWG